MALSNREDSQRRKKMEGEKRGRERQGEGIRHVAALDRVHRGCTNAEMGKDIN